MKNHSEPLLDKNSTKKSSESNHESKSVAFVAPLESNKKEKKDEEINHSNIDKNNQENEIKNNKTNENLEITRIELEYKLKEKQQLLEIELLRQRLAETERAMANIISKMDMIPTQKAQKVRHIYSFLSLKFLSFFLFSPAQN